MGVLVLTAVFCGSTVAGLVAIALGVTSMLALWLLLWWLAKVLLVGAVHFAVVLAVGFVGRSVVNIVVGRRRPLRFHLTPRALSPAQAVPTIGVWFLLLL